jgi:hypothetical protein
MLAVSARRAGWSSASRIRGLFPVIKVTLERVVDLHGMQNALVADTVKTHRCGIEL